MKASEVTTATRMFFINKTKKTVGKIYPATVATKKLANEFVRLELSFSLSIDASKDDIEFYFNEVEWLEDVKNL